MRHERMSAKRHRDGLGQPDIPLRRALWGRTGLAIFGLVRVAEHVTPGHLFEGVVPGVLVSPDRIEDDEWGGKQSVIIGSRKVPLNHVVQWRKDPNFYPGSGWGGGWRIPVPHES